MQWVGDQVEVVEADEIACVAVDVQDGHMECLTGWDLTVYDYMSVSKDGFDPINVKPMMSSTQLINNVL
jgi:hypothetical protein